MNASDETPQATDITDLYPAIEWIESAVNQFAENIIAGNSPPGEVNYCSGFIRGVAALSLSHHPAHDDAIDDFCEVAVELIIQWARAETLKQMRIN